MRLENEFATGTNISVSVQTGKPLIRDLSKQLKPASKEEFSLFIGLKESGQQESRLARS